MEAAGRAQDKAKILVPDRRSSLTASECVSDAGEVGLRGRLTTRRKRQLIDFL